ncbi:MAG: TraB domain-containing protein [Thermoplasmata archaeon]|nr:TraB domain-containing protein [Thermoplasmata archaeon]
MYSSTTEAPILLIGSAHVVDLDRPMRALLGERVLDAIAVELDEERAAKILAEHAPAERGSGRGQPLFVRLWGLLQKRLGEQLGGGIAGAEMRTASRLSQERNLPLFLIDDPIRETLQRLLRSMSVKERFSLLLGGILGLFVPSRLVAEKIDQYAEAPNEYLDEIRRAFPGVARVLLDERNEHMADRLRELRGRGFGRVAVIVGDAHLPGLREALGRRGILVETVSLAQMRAPAGPS